MFTIWYIVLHFYVYKHVLPSFPFSYFYSVYILYILKKIPFTDVYQFLFFACLQVLHVLYLCFTVVLHFTVFYPITFLSFSLLFTCLFTLCLLVVPFVPFTLPLTHEYSFLKCLHLFVFILFTGFYVFTFVYFLICFIFYIFTCLTSFQLSLFLPFYMFYICVPSSPSFHFCTFSLFYILFA